QKAMPELEWKEMTSWMGFRPAPSDSIPLIGELDKNSGIYLGFGHHHVGLTGGPKTGRLLAQMMTGQTPNMNMTAYSPSRFR
ncbi:MAG: NAD(P)/FAD-dependent oxidoreductase, partial [Candidatus Puniceispirillaceae bacterium]